MLTARRSQIHAPRTLIQTNHNSLGTASTANQTLSMSLTSGARAGSTLIFGLVIDPQPGTPATIVTVPAGWTLLGSYNASPTGKFYPANFIYMLGDVAGGATGPYAWTFNSNAGYGNDAYGAIAEFGGSSTSPAGDLASPGATVEAAANAATTTTATCSSAPAAGAELAVAMFGWDSSPASVGAAPGWYTAVDGHADTKFFGMMLWQQAGPSAPSASLPWTAPGSTTDGSGLIVTVKG